MAKPYYHRADDLPPYITIVIVGHVIIGGYMMTDLVWPMPLWLPPSPSGRR